MSNLLVLQESHEYQIIVLFIVRRFLVLQIDGLVISGCGVLLPDTIDWAFNLCVSRGFSFDLNVTRIYLKMTANLNLNGVSTSPSTSPNLSQKNLNLEREKYLENFNFPFCDPSANYVKQAKIGHGTFGYILAQI